MEGVRGEHLCDLKKNGVKEFVCLFVTKFDPFIISGLVEQNG